MNTSSRRAGVLAIGAAATLIALPVLRFGGPAAGAVDPSVHLEQPVRAVSDMSSLTAYRLAPGLIRTTAAGTPSQVAGVLAMPRGRGPHPVVVVLHGAAPQCVWLPAAGIKSDAISRTWPRVCAGPRDTRKSSPSVGPRYVQHELGMSYLTQALARQGFVAVSIDVTAPEQYWTGEPDPARGYRELIAAHLRLLDDLNRGISHGLGIRHTKGRIDTSRIGLVGHSRGADHVLWEAAGRLPGLFGVVSIQPPVGSPSTRPGVVPILNIRSSCDEQVGPRAGLATLKGWAARRSTKTIIDVSINGATHAAFNTFWSPLAYEQNDGSQTIGDCSPAQVAAPGPSRGEGARLAADFLHQALLGARTYSLPRLPGVHLTARNLVRGGSPVKLEDGTWRWYTDPHKIRRAGSSDALLPRIPHDLVIHKDPFGENG